MQPQTSAAIHAVWAKVHSPKGLSFAQTVSELASLGVTRYRVDYVAGTATAYVGHEADTFTIPKHGVPSGNWDATGLTAAIRGAQSGTIGNYADFARAAAAAGVTDYTAYLVGQRVVYAGGLGDQHIEWFPGSKRD